MDKINNDKVRLYVGQAQALVWNTRVKVMQILNLKK